jgi:TPR repeat protein
MKPMFLRVACMLTLLCGAATAQPALKPTVQAELDRAVQAYVAGRLASARAAFASLARRQVPAAEYNLAVMHLRGEMPAPSRAAARRLLEHAAGAGFVTAQLMLAQGLESGDLGPRDLATAHRWYAAAAERGNVEAQLAMGTAHYLGRGAPKDPARAVHWFREAAKGGDVGAMYLLASMYEQGDGVERDLRLARYWYDMAARAGDPAAPGKLQQIDALLGAAPAAASTAPP